MSSPCRHPLSVFPTAFILLLSSLLSACAARSAGSSGGHFALSRSDPTEFASEDGEHSGSLFLTLQLPPNTEPPEQARRVEATRALEGAWAMVRNTDSPGTKWSFRFWSHHGTLTLLSVRRVEEGEGRASTVDRGAFLRRLERELPTLLGTQPREVTLTLERQETHWSADLDTSLRESPPVYARTIPSVSGGTSQESYRQALDVAQSMARLMTVPRGGSAQLVVQITLEDDRLTGWDPGELDSSGDGPALLAPAEAVTTVLGTLLPFTRALGDRTVALTLRGEHRQGDASPRWVVMEARTLEPPPPPKEMADFAQEYRELHERIFVEFQEQSREYAVLAAGFTVEQIAYTVVGGLVLKGILATIRVAAPTITSMLAQGGRGAVHWFRTLLVRAGPREQALLRQLSLKIETQGFSSLTAAEKQQLHTLMGRLEKVLGTPLDRRVKRDLWQLARKEYFELHRPEFARLLGKDGLKLYQVHHICPMEYAHLFAKLDINGKANLAGVHLNIHRSISKVWTSMRESSERMGPKEVNRVIDIVNRHYARWFNKLYDVKDASALANAERAALSEVAQLKAHLAL